MAPTQIRNQLLGKIEYAIVALGLRAAELSVIIKEATGVTVDGEPSGALKALDTPRLDAVWMRLSENPRWNKSSRSA